MTTAASCPWNLSTVPILAPGKRSLKAVHLIVIWSDNQDIILGQRPIATVAIDPHRASLRQMFNDGRNAFDLFNGIGLIGSHGRPAPTMPDPRLRKGALGHFQALSFSRPARDTRRPS